MFNFEFLLILAAIIFLIIIVMITTARMVFHGDLASIESLRRDIDDVDAALSHEIISKAASVNQRIDTAKAYRKIWWAKPFYPKGWEKIGLINIPKNSG